VALKYKGGGRTNCESGGLPFGPLYYNGRWQSKFKDRGVRRESGLFIKISFDKKHWLQLKFKGRQGQQY
jgi:hypothetical protein